jgi:gluconokinase
MPPSLLTSQFHTLEPLADDELGIVIDVDQTIDAIVEAYITQTRTEQTGTEEN